MYLRMFVMMLITLYSSRVALNVLGIDNYGVYNLVAGVVVLFSFIDASLSSSTYRYLCVALGRNDHAGVKRYFSAGLIVNILLCPLLILIAETIGLWFVSNCVNIPAASFRSAMIVYQIAILTTCFQLLRVPFNAAVLAHEKMSFFATTSIIEATLKLGVIFLLIFVNVDKLILYAWLLCGVAGLTTLWFAIYCVRNFKGIELSLKSDRRAAGELLAFSGWNVFGSLADVGCRQGVGIILNIFCGVALNATMGIINQVRTAIFAFCTNFQQAVNPQINKCYGAGDINRFRMLIMASSKFSFYLMFLLALPLGLCADWVLTWWLKTPPPSATSFMIVTLICCMLDSLCGPLWTAMQATGKIRKYQIVISALLMLNLPLSALVLWLKCPPVSVMWVQACVLLIIVITRVWFAERRCELPATLYLQNVVWPIVRVVLIASILPVAIFLVSTGVVRLLIELPVAILSVAASVYMVGLSVQEKMLLKQIVAKKLMKR